MARASLPLVYLTAKANVKEKGERDPMGHYYSHPAPRREARLQVGNSGGRPGTGGPWAVDAQEYPVGDAGPAGVLGTTVKNTPERKVQNSVTN